MRKESFDRAIVEITNFIKSDIRKAYTTNDIQELFESQREKWRIAQYRNYKHFITFLSNSKILILDIQNHESHNSEKQILRKKTCTPFDVSLIVKKDGYLCNYSAMQIHQLTLQIPKTVYVSEDKYAPYYEKNHIKLEQDSVDKAFSKPQRISKESYKSEYDGFRYVYLQKKHNSRNVGITTIDNLAVTDLERTLIDIAVRPAYSGGAFQILEAFNNAKEKVNINTLNNYIEKLDYIYPYHQLIGFYLDLAGFPDTALKLFLQKKTHIKFYQTYNLTNKKLNEKWGIYYPTGLEAL
jgi:predicted transcriptional regulator of viral defense system